MSRLSFCSEVEDFWILLLSALICTGLVIRNHILHPSCGPFAISSPLKISSNPIPLVVQH